jgi:hypothetical protein
MTHEVVFDINTSIDQTLTKVFKKDVSVKELINLLRKLPKETQMGGQGGALEIVAVMVLRSGFVKICYGAAGGAVVGGATCNPCVMTTFSIVGALITFLYLYATYEAAVAPRYHGGGSSKHDDQIQDIEEFHELLKHRIGVCNYEIIVSQVFEILKESNFKSGDTIPLTSLTKPAIYLYTLIYPSILEEYKSNSKSAIHKTLKYLGIKDSNSKSSTRKRNYSRNRPRSLTMRN